MKNLTTGALFGLLVGLNLVQLGLSWGLSKSDWAAWVQAFGSIGAIIGAVYVSNAEGVRARKLLAERDDMKRANQILLSVMQGTHLRRIVKDLAGAVGNAAFRDEDLRFHHARLGVVLRGLDSVQFDALSVEAGRSVAATNMMGAELHAATAIPPSNGINAKDPETYVSFNLGISAQMGLLCTEYESITGRSPFD